MLQSKLTSYVMTGLEPVIQEQLLLDCRVKPGNDD
jgi:hypothetical protein